jgi:hypothetical protein
MLNSDLSFRQIFDDMILLLFSMITGKKLKKSLKHIFISNLVQGKKGTIAFDFFMFKKIAVKPLNDKVWGCLNIAIYPYQSEIVVNTPQYAFAQH